MNIKKKDEKKKKGAYNLKSFESISHGNIGNISWDFVSLAKKLKLFPCKAMEIHFFSKDQRNKRR